MEPRKGFNIDVALSGIHNSLNATEAEKSLKRSCALCYKQGWCNEDLCRVYREYKIKLNSLAADALAKKVCMTTEWQETRSYDQNELRSAKKSALRIINTFERHNGEDEFVKTCRLYLTQRNYGLLEDYMVQKGYFDLRCKLPERYEKIIKALRMVVKES